MQPSIELKPPYNDTPGPENPVKAGMRGVVTYGKTKRLSTIINTEEGLKFEWGEHFLPVSQLKSFDHLPSRRPYIIIEELMDAVGYVVSVKRKIFGQQEESEIFENYKDAMAVAKDYAKRYGFPIRGLM